MSSLRKNVASQNITFQLIKAADGTAVTAGGAGNVSKDGGAQAACAGTFTHLGTGQWLYVPTQAETNATAVGFQFTGTGAININLHFFTDNWDTTQAVITSGTGTAQLSVTSGVASANATQINGVATTSVTTVNANQGTTQPINFTGTAGSALVKGDTVDIAGSAVSASTAQLGVNVVNIAGTASKGAAGYVGIDWAQISAPTTTVDLSGTTIKGLDTAPPTAAAIATAVWQDATAGDFTVANSIGKSLYTSGVVPGAAGGLFIAGTNAATTITTGLTTTFTGNLTGSVNSVATAVTVNGASTLTEAYSAPGAGLTLATALYAIVQQMGEMSISGTTMTTKKRDQSTTAQTFTLNSATAPTAITQAT